MKFGDLADSYLRETKECCATKTYESYTKALRPVLAAFKDRDADSISQKDVERYVNKRSRRGVGRGILYELGRLRAVLRHGNISTILNTPRKLQGLSKKERHVPSDSDAALIYNYGNRKVQRAIALALFAGMRHEEVFKLRPEHVDLEARTITITEDIRKTHTKHVLPIGDLLFAHLSETWLGMGSKTVENALRRLSNQLEGSGLSRPWRGLQPARRLLMVWGGEAGYAGVMHLISGHKPTGMEWRYTHSQGYMELKKEIIAAVENRLLTAIEKLTGNEHYTQEQNDASNETVGNGITRVAPHRLAERDQRSTAQSCHPYSYYPSWNRDGS
jgi:integrase